MRLYNIEINNSEEGDMAQKILFLKDFRWNSVGKNLKFFDSLKYISVWSEGVLGCSEGKLPGTTLTFEEFLNKMEEEL
jgi:hypothetical protein